MNFKTHLYTAQLKLRQSFLGRFYALSSTAKSEIDNHTFEPKRVLFILSGLIGDSIMSFPAVTEARRLWPGAHVTVLGKTHNHQLFAACSEIDEFRVCDADPFSIRRSEEIKQLRTWLSNAEFDAAIILLGDQYAHLLAKAKIPVRVGVSGTPLASCLTHTYEIGSPRTWGTKERLNALRCLGYEIADNRPAILVNRESEKTANEKLHQLGLADQEPYVVLHPYGSTSRQWWNPDNLASAAESVLKAHDARTVLIGGNETRSTDISSEAIIDTRGRLTLQELLAVIDGSKLVISTDSGPFHIAGALRKPIVGLFRSRRPEHAEAYPNTGVIFGRDDSCMLNCKWDRCTSDPCRQMSDITVEDLASAIPENIT